MTQHLLPFDQPEKPLPPRFAAFLQFHADNPQVFAWFVHFAREALRSGRKRVGGRFIGERIRWQAMIETQRGEEDFLINDHHWPYYARLAMARHADLEGMFETRDARFDTTVEELNRRAA